MRPVDFERISQRASLKALAEDQLEDIPGLDVLLPGAPQPPRSVAPRKFDTLNTKPHHCNRLAEIGGGWRWYGREPRSGRAAACKPARGRHLSGEGAAGRGGHT